jgi:hypothetical protein
MRIIVALLISFAIVNLYGQQASSFLVRVDESQIDDSPSGGTVSNCIIVTSDGRVHAERRLQKFPTPSATLRVYEGFIGDVKLRELRDLLANRDIKDLPRFVPPKTPGAVYLRTSTTVDIVSDDIAKTVGYMRWKSVKSQDSFESAPEEVKVKELKAESILKPLVTWLNKIDLEQFQTSHVSSNQCSADL